MPTPYMEAAAAIRLGKLAAAAYAEGLDEFLSNRGLNLANPSPRALKSVGELSDFHAIVSLQGPVHTHVEAVPFHTIALEWKIDDVSGDELDNLYRTLAAQIDELMTTLHGGEGEV